MKIEKLLSARVRNIKTNPFLEDLTAQNYFVLLDLLKKDLF